MIKKDRYIITGIDQDTAPDKRQMDTAYDAENIRIVNNGRNLSIQPIKEALEFSTPTLSVSQSVIGGIEINNNLYIFTTNNSGSDYIRKIDSAGNMTTLITDDFGFNTSNRLEIVANYENDSIIKLYWTDGVNQVRFINVENPSSKINLVEIISLSQLSTTVQQGGNLLAGNIQYCYNLYNLNGSESVLSPMSQINSLTEYMSGFESGEDTGLSVALSAIIDTNFDYIRVYSIHWQELNQTPTITLITDEEISSANFTFVDDGNSFVQELSESELTSIGGRPIIAQTLAAKRNRLFLGNITTNDFDPDIDVRAFGHTKSSTNYRVKNTDGSDSAIRTLPTVPGDTHDCVNYDYDTYRFLQSSTSWGVEGQNIEVKLVYDNDPLFDQINNTTNARKSLKRGEIYRIGIVFYNSLGQRSPAKWVADIKMPTVQDIADAAGVYDANGMYNIFALEVTLKNQSSYIALGVEKYQLVAVERTISDRTIVAQGIIQPTVQYLEGANFGGDLHSPYYHPYYITKDIKTVLSTEGANIINSYKPEKDWIDPAWTGDANDASYPVKHDEFCVFYSSDTILGEMLPNVSDIRIVGSHRRSSYNGATKLERYNNNIPQGSLIVNSDPLYYGLDSSPYPGSAFPETLLSWSNYGVDDEIDVYETVYLHRYAGNYYEPETTTIDIALDGTSKNFSAGEIKAYDSTYVLGNTVSISDLYTRIAILKETQTKYNHRFPGCVGLKFSSSTWHRTTIDWDKFLANTDRSNTYGAIPIVELIRDLPNQYGGQSYEAKQRNSYLIEGTLGSVSSVTTNYVGDIYIAPFAFQRADGEHNLSDQSFNIYDYIYVRFLEHNQNVIARNDGCYTIGAGLESATQYQNLRLFDNHKLLGAYNQKPNLILAPSKPANFNTVNKFENVVQASQEKFSNELIDSWTKYPVNETRELEGIYGPITKLYNFNGEIYSLQKSGVAALSINPRIQTQATDGVNIELGIGAVLYDHRYLNTQSGTVDKFSVVDDGRLLMYYDRTYNTINTLDGQKISTLLGIRNILENSNGVPYAVYNRELDEILFSVDASTDFTLVYSTILNKFVSKETHATYYDQFKYTFGDKVLIEGDHLIPSGLLELYAGTNYKPSSITYFFGPSPTFEKVFHNLEYRLYGQNFDTIEVDGNRNNSGAAQAIDVQVKFDNHRVHLPRVYDGGVTHERFREHNILVKLNHNNTEHYQLDDMVIYYNIKG